MNSLERIKIKSKNNPTTIQNSTKFINNRKFMEEYVRKISFSNISLFITFVGSVIAIFLSLALIGYSNMMVLLLLLPLLLFSISMGAFSGTIFLGLFLFFLPLVGFFEYQLNIHGVSLMMPYLFAGYLGHLLSRLLQVKKQPPNDLTISVWFFLATTFFSLFVSLWSYRESILDFQKIVNQTPWISISMANAIGWIVSNFLSVLSGVLFFQWTKEECRLPSNRAPLLKYVMFSFFIPFLVGILQYKGWWSSSIPNQFVVAGLYQFNSTFLDPNSLGFYSALLLPLSIGYCLENYKIWLRWIAAVLLIFLLFISNSRSAFMSAFVSLIIFVPSYIWNRHKWVSLASFLAFVLVGLIAPMFFENSRFGMTIRKGWEMILHPSTLGNLLGDRNLLWKAGWVVFIQNPLIGIGLGTYLMKMPLYKEIIGPIYNDNCGNMYLHILAEQGIIGLLSFFYLLGSFFYRGYNNFKNSSPTQKATLSTIFGLSFSFLFGAHLLSYTVNILFWFLLAWFPTPIEKENKVS